MNPLASFKIETFEIKIFYFIALIPLSGAKNWSGEMNRYAVSLDRLPRQNTWHLLSNIRSEITA